MIHSYFLVLLFWIKLREQLFMQCIIYYVIIHFRPKSASIQSW